MNARPTRRPRHPRLEVLAQRGARLAQLAIERVALNAADPKTYPLPRSPRSAERIIKKIIDELPSDRRQAIYERARVHRGESAAARRNRLGDVARVDLRSPVAIGDQIAKLATPPSVRIPLRDHAAILESVGATRIPNLNVPSATAAPATTLEIRLDTIECFRQTFKEKGSDEIVGSLVLLNEKGEISSSAVSDLGAFAADSTRSFGGKLLHSIDISTGTFPKALVYFPVLVERDHDTLGRILLLLGTVLGLVGGVVALVGVATGNVVVTLIGFAAQILGGLLELLAWFMQDTCIVTEDLAGVLVESAAEPPGDLDTTRFNMDEQENFFGNATGQYDVTISSRLV